jgi:glycosyltransferase involved in cell wall biosynthesis
MKIALIVPGGVDRSGDVRIIPALLSLIRRLASEHDLHVFATHQEASPGSWSLEGARVHSLGQPRTARRAAFAVWAEHRIAPFHVLHAIWGGRHGALAVGMGSLLRVPSLVHVAGGELVALTDIGYGGCSSWRGRLLEHTVLSRATRVTAASAPICDLIARHGVHAQRVPLGVDLQRWPIRHPVTRRPKEKARLVHVASLNLVKDQATLLRAMRLLASGGCDFHLDVVGEDTLGGKIQALATELGVSDRTCFHGFLTQRELRPIVEGAHVALITSRHEAGPLAVLEAAAVGVPTVGTAVGHIAEWNPVAASAVPCGDAPALAAALRALLENDDLRMRLAGEALRRAELEDADHTARSFNAIYRQVSHDRVGVAETPTAEKPDLQR